MNSVICYPQVALANSHMKETRHKVYEEKRQARYHYRTFHEYAAIKCI